MNAEIISIGDEILIGQIVNTNATYLSQKLTEIGIKVKWISVVGDGLEDIQDAFRLALSRADVIISTGGLGPTHDDVSKKAITDFFGSKLVFDELVYKNVEQIFTRMGRIVDERNREQALVPEIADVLANPVGTAPGLMIESDGKLVFILPGVPMEMKGIFEAHITSKIVQRNEGQVIRFITILTAGIFESDLFNRTRDIIESLEGQVQVASLPGPTGVRLRLTVQGMNSDECETRLNSGLAKFRDRLGSLIYGYGDDTMDTKIAATLLESGKSLAIFDAFTGGAIAGNLLAVDDSDKYLKGSLLFPEKVTKFCGLGADSTTCFALSFNYESDTQILARQIRKKFRAKIGMAVLPQYFPEQNSALIHVVINEVDKNSYKTFQLRLERSDIKQRAAHFALNILRLSL